MMLVGSALRRFAIEASDGRIGQVSDFLFDDLTWKIRWMVVDTGTWLTGRKVLIHPSVIGQPDYARESVSLRLTRAQVKGSPDVLSDEPVSRQMEQNIYGYYGWDPLWGNGNYFGSYPYTLGSPMMPVAPPKHAGVLEADRPGSAADEGGDPHLRSMNAVTGYHVRATDGSMGHVENFLIDDADWGIRYVVVDTKNWWAGQHVLISPYAVRKISWLDHEVMLDVSRDFVKGSPAWDPVAAIDKTYERQLHDYYGWPGYGW